jgi:hypothetical protein
VGGPPGPFGAMPGAPGPPGAAPLSVLLLGQPATIIRVATRATRTNATSSVRVMFFTFLSFKKLTSLPVRNGSYYTKYANESKGEGKLQPASGAIDALAPPGQSRLEIGCGCFMASMKRANS